MTHTSEFGRSLKTVRQALGLTQERLAERVGCATETIRKLENGSRRPSFQMAVRIVETLGVEPEERPQWLQMARRPADESQVTVAMGSESAEDRATLPVYLTPFIGREQEQAVLTAQLEQPAYRLVTLLGPGGIGKSRLAIEVAHQMSRFRDGVFFVPLAPVTTPKAIITAIGAGLRFNFSGPGDLTMQLWRHLHDKQILLILDNLEHLLTPPEATLTLLEQLLGQAPHLTLLVTSRERLRLPGEWVREINGLPVPPADVWPYPNDYPACILFAEHARRIWEDFHLGPETRGPAAAICRLVEGNPLGIELAASWLRVLSLEEIGQELLNNLNAEHLSPGTMPARHRSLWSVVDHSWKLLSDAEQKVMEKLAIFQAGFSREAAAQVAQADLFLLASLGDKSLLRRKANGRYELHEMIKQHAAVRLKMTVEREQNVRDRHASYYCGWLGEREKRLQSREQRTIMAEIGAETDNIREAWSHAAERKLLPALGQAADTLQWFYEFRSLFAEGTAMFQLAADALQPADGVIESAERRYLRGEILARLGYLATRSGDTELARQSLVDALELLLSNPDPVPLALTLAYQAMLSFFRGEYKQAHKALKWCRTLIPPDEFFINAFCDTWNNMVALTLGEYETAERFFRDGLARYRLMGHERGVLIATTFGSTCLIALGKYTEIEQLLHEGMKIADELDDRYGSATALHQLGLVAQAQKNKDVAVERFREALLLFQDLGSAWDIARVSNHLGAALLDKGHVVDASHAFHTALTTALAVQIIPEALTALLGFADLLYQQRVNHQALKTVACILADPAANSTTRQHALQLRDMLHRRLLPNEIIQIEGAGTRLSCTEIAAEFMSLLPL